MKRIEALGNGSENDSRCFSMSTSEQSSPWLHDTQMSEAMQRFSFCFRALSKEHRPSKRSLERFSTSAHARLIDR